MKIKITGKSLNELYKEYGVGSGGFYSSDPWWKHESFEDEKPEPGEYEILFDKGSVNKTYSEQIGELKKGFTVLHPSAITEIVLSHFKETGERLLEDWYVRSDTLGSDGARVYVGRFGARGLLVSYWRDSGHDGYLGVSAARKLPLKSRKLEPLESLTLESAIKMIKKEGYKVFKEM